jgi:hypothetical protein
MRPGRGPKAAGRKTLSGIDTGARRPCPACPRRPPDQVPKRLARLAISTGHDWVLQRLPEPIPQREVHDTTNIPPNQPSGGRRGVVVYSPFVIGNEPELPVGTVVLQRSISLSSKGSRGEIGTAGIGTLIIRWSRVRAPPAPLIIEQVDPRPRAHAVVAEIRDGRWPRAFRANALRRAGWLPARHLSRHARTP